MPESIRPNPEQRNSSPEKVLEALEHNESLPEVRDVAIVVAHQDDESIAFARALFIMPNSLVVHVTDGSPESGNRTGMSREQYAHIREYEVHSALDIAEHTGTRLAFQVPDQKAAQSIVENATRLAREFKERGIRVVMTNPYEGGHPDHDAVAAAVHAAKALMQKDGLELSILEAPLYRMENGVSVRQKFIPDPRAFITEIALTQAEIHQKEQMFQAQTSQEGALDSRMSRTHESYRITPGYDFTKPANDGALSHIYADAGISADTWRELVEKARTELGLDQDLR